MLLPFPGEASDREAEKRAKRLKTVQLKRRMRKQKMTEKMKSRNRRRRKKKRRMRGMKKKWILMTVRFVQVLILSFSYI